jgi:hypothetical protein
MALNHVTVEQLSVLFEQTPRNLFLLTEKGVLKRAVDSKGKQFKPPQYELISTVRAYCAYLREMARMDDQGATVYQQLRNKKIGAEAERAVLDLQVHKRKLHTSAQIEFVMTTMLTSIKSRLLSIPSRITRVLMGKTDFHDIYSIIDAEIELALRELSDYDPNAFVRAGEDPAAAGTQSVRKNGDSNHRKAEDEDLAEDPALAAEPH